MSNRSSSQTSNPSSSDLHADSANLALDQKDDELKSGQKVFFICAIAIVLIEAAVFLFFLKGRNLIGNFELNKENESAVGQWTEVKIGEYDVRNRSFGDLDIQVAMTVYAKIETQNSQRFREELEKKRKRVDEAISTVVRTADYVELQEPTLHSLRRRVTYAVKQVLQEMENVDEVILPDFRTYPS